MVKHIVALKLKENAGGKSKDENARMLKREIEGLKSKIKEIRTIEVGINFNPAADAYHLVVVAEFSNKKDLDTYQNHPEHQRIVGIMKEVHDTRVVVDYES